MCFYIFLPEIVTNVETNVIPEATESLTTGKLPEHHQGCNGSVGKLEQGFGGRCHLNRCLYWSIVECNKASGNYICPLSITASFNLMKDFLCSGLEGYFFYSFPIFLFTEMSWLNSCSWSYATFCRTCKSVCVLLLKGLTHGSFCPLFRQNNFYVIN